MLRSERSSNNEEDDSPTLLGKDMQLSMTYDQPQFTLKKEEIEKAMQHCTNEVEQQVLVYFAGYILHKLTIWHKSDCDACNRFGKKFKGEVPESVATRDLFLWLKKYDSNCHLYRPTDEFVQYVGQIAGLVTYCFSHYLTYCKIISSMTDIALEHVTSPVFCSFLMKRKTVKLVVKTLFLYKLKWFNDTIKKQDKKSQRKLNIVQHRNA